MPQNTRCYQWWLDILYSRIIVVSFLTDYRFLSFEFSSKCLSWLGQSTYIKMMRVWFIGLHGMVYAFPEVVCPGMCRFPSCLLLDHWFDFEYRVLLVLHWSCVHQSDCLWCFSASHMLVEIVFSCCEVSVALFSSRRFLYLTILVFHGTFDRFDPTRE